MDKRVEELKKFVRHLGNCATWEPSKFGAAARAAQLARGCTCGMLAVVQGITDELPKAKKWKAVANNLAAVLELELGTGKQTLQSQIRSEGLEEDMRVRLTLDQREKKRITEALPDLIHAGAIEPTIRESKANPDGPIELAFRLDSQLELSAVLACAGLADLTPFARTL